MTTGIDSEGHGVLGRVGRVPGRTIPAPDEPIAIVGMACQFPGAKDVSEFWRQLASGANLVTEGEPGSGVGRVGQLFSNAATVHRACRYGAYLTDIEQFDAEFFRIAPVEAESLDPQQRLLLETSWQALEDAGLDPDRLRGARCGVYVGIGANDYKDVIQSDGQKSGTEANLYLVTGNRFSTAIGRVSFALGMEGPAVAVDTACSSSLVAVHHAVVSLQRSESDLVLVGGVNVLLAAEATEAFANAGMLSPTGRCWTFDAAADGFVRSEGCGVVVLKRLSEAEADGDRIWGVIRGTAVNQDGARQGLTVPKAPTQEKVIAEALARAGLLPTDVDYLEAHGTGTRVGDPTEVEAAAAAYSQGRDPHRPLLIGSVKTNIGHLAAAAGMAGLIKAVLAMQQGVIPKHLNFSVPNPAIDWDSMPVRVTAEATPWPLEPGRPPRSGVNSFGFSGTNAHVLLEGYGTPGDVKWPSPSGPARPVAVLLPEGVSEDSSAVAGSSRRGTRFLPLSGKTEVALQELAGRYVSWLDGRAGKDPAESSAAGSLLSDMAWTASVGRSHFDWRAGVVFRDDSTLRDELQEVSSGREGLERPDRRVPSKVAFLFTGLGSQWDGMGEALYAREPVVRTVLDRCDTVIRQERGASLLDVMFGRPGAAGALDDPAWTQPALYALECALAALWSSVGIRPGVVAGHSLGEVSAAHVAGVFSLEDGLRFASARGALMSALPEPGAMAAVFASAPRVEAAVHEHNARGEGHRLDIAADNGAHQVVSGPVADVEAISERFLGEDVRVRRLNTGQAFHSALVEPALDDLEAVVGGIAITSPQITLVSNVSGQVVKPGETLDGPYWRRHARQAVMFGRSLETLADLGVDAVIEIGPHAVLGPMLTLAWPGDAPVTLSSMRRPPKDDEVPKAELGCEFVEAVAGAYEVGLEVSFDGLFAGEKRRRISLPGYPFQRQRHWIEEPRRRRQVAGGHPLLGVRHESPRGEILFESELSTSDPAWLDDHRVFGRVLAPGAMYGAMAASALFAEGASTVVVEDMQLQSPLVFPEAGLDAEGMTVELVLDSAQSAPSRRLEIFSRDRDGDGWTQHAEARVLSGESVPRPAASVDPESLTDGLSPVNVSALYRAKASQGIELGLAFRSLQAAWSGRGESVAEVALPDGVDRTGLEVHPILLDGCFQAVLAARDPGGSAEGEAYLPFGWERLWLPGRLPERVICHVRMREPGGQGGQDDSIDGPLEVLKADIGIYSPDGTELGELSGFTSKRATRGALLSAAEGTQDLLYETVWRSLPLAEGTQPADFLALSGTVAARTEPFSWYLAQHGVDKQGRSELLRDLERLAWSYALKALENLGWDRKADEAVDPEDLRGRLDVPEAHRRLFHRMLDLLGTAGVLTEMEGTGWRVVVGPDDPLPDESLEDPESFADGMVSRYPHGSTELALFRQSAGALADVLRGRIDPLSLLFGDTGPNAADLYKKAPVARAANQMLQDAVAVTLAELPEGRRLRLIEVGAGTGSATAVVLPELPAGRFDYVYTDISAGFFAEAEDRFGTGEGDAAIDYRVLDIEADPLEQGFDPHGYDLVIASNVLHATRYLHETLAHCRDLLAPSGLLVALENLGGQGWLDLTFGQLDGWWRFADSYRPRHALAEPAVWRQALADAGFGEVAVLGSDESFLAGKPDRGVILARGPEEVAEPPGVWVLVADRGGAAAQLAAGLASRNQEAVLAGARDAVDGRSAGKGIVEACLDPHQREAWQGLLEGLPEDVPFRGVVHLVALDGHGGQATTAEMDADVKDAASTALALVQGLLDASATPRAGVWFVTSGAQVLERERLGQLAGATLWGVGKVAAREVAHLEPRMIDLDPGQAEFSDDLVRELLSPDTETHIAYRGGRRQVARLVRAGTETARPALPDEPGWLLAPETTGGLGSLKVESMPPHSLEPREVRVAVEAAGLNFWDLFRAMGVIEEGLLGGEFCGQVVEVGSEVSSVSAGDRVVGLAFGTFGPEAVMHEDLVTPAPTSIPVTSLATIPTAFVSAALSFDMAALRTGERVLVHAGAGGVGMAAIQLAHAAGAEVIATASAPKQGFLRSLGVKHVFDSRQTLFGEQTLEATARAGVDVVLNSLTGPGFIEASLSCLAHGGRFVELARRDIWTEKEMSEARPDVAYSILELDTIKERDTALGGAALRRVMRQLSTGEVSPMMHSRWPLAEAGAAMEFMRSARHIGKIVLAAPPLRSGRVRPDRTYLITGGLGGIGCAVGGWLADRGARTIVLNGRRDPDEAAAETIRDLQERGLTVQVELADVTDPAAIDAMLSRVDRTLPPLGGLVHSVGLLADRSLANQTWDLFDQVLRPKVLGAWHLHRATLDRDLDLFVLFSSMAGVLGSPGQSNHAAANAFLDQLAGHRRALGLSAQTIAWGAWSGLGEAEEQRERIERQLAASGTRWITPQQGLKALDTLVRQDVTRAAVSAVDWDVLAESIDSRPPFLEDLLTVAAVDDSDASSGDLLTQLRETPAAERKGLLVSFILQELKSVLRLSSLPSPSVGFFDLGIDSLMAVELRNRLNRAFAGEYVASNTAVFDYPNATDLSQHLIAELGEFSETPAVPKGRFVPEWRPPVQRDEDRIAIVGMACRFPGAADVAAFWRQLESGQSAVTDGRKDDAILTGITGDPAFEDAAFRTGAFVDGIDQFDAGFFGVRPIAARMMDPQQRLLLETSWEALEDAGIDPGRLKGSRAGVYVGVGASEYRDLIAASGATESFLGTASSVAVGRVAFTLGLMGPAMPLDAACASSLVAVHQAVAALQRSEVDLALVGGVNAVLSPALTRFMAEIGMLSRSGRCSAFDASADGFVRGEGCGMVVLKRLGEAEAAGDRIWGVIGGSAVNQNGASAGLTVPNGMAQQQVMEEAMARAEVASTEVDYLEAHGTGSDFGDPIEMRAVTAAYGRDRLPDHPLLIGTVKTNIGHLESAAGISSLIKVVLAMNSGMIPKHLNFRDPNPHIGWEKLPVRVTSDAQDWPLEPGRPMRAGVSAFGMSGTNAHVVVEGYGVPVDAGNSLFPSGAPRLVEATVPETAPGLLLDSREFRPRDARFLPLSGKSAEAVHELAQRYLSWMDERADALSADGSAGGQLLSDMAWTAGSGRSHFAHRAAIVFHDAASLRDGLQGLPGPAPESSRGEPWAATKVAFAFADDGGQWVGMGETLYASEPVVRAVLNRCDAALQGERETSLLDVMFGRPGSGEDLDDPAWAQPALYALECALTALWATTGVRPNLAFGHGLGELAAAQAAGVFDLAEGLRIASARGRAMSAHPGGGSDGSPTDAMGIALEGAAFSSPSVDLVSGMTGHVVGSGEVLDPEYWRRRAQPSTPLDGPAWSLAGLGVDLVVEIGPQSELGPELASDRIPGRSRGDGCPAVVSSLERQLSGSPAAQGGSGFETAAAQLYEAGLPISFAGLFAGETRSRISLPTYAFQRRRYWFSDFRRPSSASAP
ncbi:MAG: SDR family NAD(P)-dependent oxidoreductase [Bryobacterales bacterium]|nr:SDR family NAD(P)-dependent oxidoreductase [Bryobacterales bacterium]